MMPNQQAEGQAEADEGLDRLKTIRGGNRAVVTRLIKESDDILDQGGIDDSRNDRLQVILSSLENKMKILDVMDGNILNKVPLDQINMEIDASTEISTKIIASKNKIARKLEQISSNTVGRGASPVPSHTSSGGMQNVVKLPELKIKSFKGDIKSWRPFWDAFKAAIHSREDIAEVDKFRYLLQYLEGDAERSIQGLPVTALNYQEAVETLHERFGKPQEIVAAHMHALLKIPPCTSIKEVKQLRAILDKLNINVRGLQSLGINSEMYGALLIPVIMSKVPDEIHLLIARSCTGAIWDIDNVLKIFKQEVEARESAVATKAGEVERKVHAPVFPRSTSTTSFMTQSEGGKILCAFCKKDHFSAACQAVKDVNERRQILIREQKCFLCLKGNHRANECRRTINCRKCHRRHHHSICMSNAERESGGAAQGAVAPENARVTQTNPEITTANTATGTSTSVILQTATVIARGADGKGIPVRVLFDSGSQRSYVAESLKKRLGLQPIRTQTLNVTTFGDKSFRKQKCDVVKISLQREGGGGKAVISAFSFPTICSKLPLPVKIDQFAKLKSLDLADAPENINRPIEILVGSDEYWGIVTGGKVIRDRGLVAVESKLGWLLSGVCEGTTGKKKSSHDSFASTNLIFNDGDAYLQEERDDLKAQLACFWETESIGVKGESAESKIYDNKGFLRSIQHDGTRYSVDLPWTAEKEQLPDHEKLCEDRALRLHERLKRNPELMEKYDEIMKEQLKTGVLEPVPEKDAENKEGTVHVLPHHPVVREDKSTTKVRVVYDGSAHTKDNPVSINHYLEQGPNLIPSLFEILLRFRSNRIGVIADIEKAFLQLGINEKDRDALRLLWFDDVRKDNPGLLKLRFQRLAFGLKSSPAILGATIMHHLSLHDQENITVKKLKEDLYIDDLTTGAETVAEAKELYMEAKRIMQNGGFNLRKWTSNSVEVCEFISMLENEGEMGDLKSEGNNSGFCEDDLSFAKTDLGKNVFATQEDDLVKILGVNWDTKNDMLVYDFSELIRYAKSLPVTKRSILSLSARIFDPLGLLSCYVIKLKMLFQILCVDNQGWDEELVGELRSKWLELIAELEFMSKQVKIPRCYFARESGAKIELHGFCDASGKAYGCAIYMRICYEDKVETVLLCSRSRVAPLKTQTIPRLELLGAVLLARLMVTVLEGLKGLVIDNVYCWTDSMTVLCWIQNVKYWGQYVSNRVDEIRCILPVSVWNHVPGAENPADLPSRGVSGYQLVNMKLWWKGPNFLELNENDWPSKGVLVPVLSDAEALKELRKDPRDTTHTFVSCDSVDSCSVGNVISCNSFSSITRLCRVTAYVLRFVRNLKHEIHLGERGYYGALEAEEIQAARHIWIMSVQAESFPGELKSLREKTSDRNLPYLTQFGLFIDEKGVLRCRGRIEKSHLPEVTCHLALLPTRHHLSDLIVKEAHYYVFHSGVRATLTAVRERYWIPRGREVVKRVIRPCIVCVKHAGKPFVRPPEPCLPSERVEDAPPFVNTGVDLAGPFFVLNKTSTSQTTEKAYICLFTCAATRAVHLELIDSCSAETFLRAFRRFVSRRGLPRKMMSDNAKNSKRSAKILKTIARAEPVKNHLASLGVTWDFIVERMSWAGGFWERLIKITKDALKRVVGGSSLTFDELSTLLTEVEGVVNARPLTYIYDDKEGISYPLCPSHLIYGRRISSLPNDEHYDIVSTNRSLTRRAKHHRNLLVQFSKRWREEYLTSLRERSRNVLGQCSDIAVGDIVFIKRDGTARSFWKLAKVVKLLRGKDGVVRAAEIRVLSEDAKTSIILRRPLELLIPTEISSNEREDHVKEDTALNPHAEPFEPKITRPVALQEIRMFNEN